MNKLLGSLFLATVLAILAPTPSRAAIACSASCSNGSSCWCAFCSCGCTSGGQAFCGNRQALAEQVLKNNLTYIKPFVEDEGEGTIDLESAEVARATTHGKITVDVDGTFLYSPDDDYVGLDSFTFKICNLSGDCDWGTVLIDVLEEK